MGITGTTIHGDRGGTTAISRITGGTRSAGRVAVLLGLLFAAALTMRGQLPDPTSAPRDPAPESPASLAGVIALLGVSLVVMAFAVWNRRPPVPKSAAWEMSGHSGGGSGRFNPRLLLIVLGFVLLWLVVFVVLSQLRFDVDVGQQAAAPPTTAPEVTSQPQPTTPSRPRESRSDTYQVLALATAGLMIMMVVATVLAALRNRPKLPPILVTGDGTGAAGAAPLALAAERGLAEVSNLRLEPREAIIACYVAMEQALAGAPGAAPQDSDTPSEVLARAVGNRTISAGSASELVEVFAEARFSRHLMTEGHREVAERTLRSVLDELRSRA